MEEWQEDYNWRRPHSGLANLTPTDGISAEKSDEQDGCMRSKI
ncbi:integrase core domain-containing protein [Falsihalocynthiibacter sp. BN13B15]